jgi:HSP20 family molecular chaperone IbpA
MDTYGLNKNTSDKSQTAGTSTEKYFTPVVDMYDNGASLVVIMDLPGVVKGDVKIEVDENNVLSVRAKSSLRELDGIVVQEFKTGNYYRAFSLSDEFSRDSINVTFENGVLEITIPRKEVHRPSKIEISV